MRDLISYAKSFIGKPYIWGGSHPALGFDCSGFMQEILASVGIDPKGDQTAQGLYDYFLYEGDKASGPFAGTLLFFGKNTESIKHVAMAVSESQMIEAGGGDQKNLTIDDAIKYGGHVRLRPISNRKDLVAILKPIYPEYLNERE